MIPGQAIRMRGECQHGNHPAKCDKLYGNVRSRCCQHPDPRDCWHTASTVVSEVCPGYGKWLVENRRGYIRLMWNYEMEATHGG